MIKIHIIIIFNKLFLSSDILRILPLKAHEKSTINHLCFCLVWTLSHTFNFITSSWNWQKEYVRQFPLKPHCYNHKRLLFIPFAGCETVLLSGTTITQIKLNLPVYTMVTHCPLAWFVSALHLFWKYKFKSSCPKLYCMFVSKQILHLVQFLFQKHIKTPPTQSCSLQWIVSLEVIVKSKSSPTI